jgi:transposase InsO family protein
VIVAPFTAAYSSESNGMAKALVKTIKRDYVYVSDCESAAVVLSMINDWFEDYNRTAPHSALPMKNPIEYLLSIKTGSLKRGPMQSRLGFYEIYFKNHYST